ncbi:MAG: ATPase domain, partial [Pseudomonadota bacterium]
MINTLIKNIGAIKHAELSLGDLTIICGANNTGKT